MSTLNSSIDAFCDEVVNTSFLCNSETMIKAFREGIHISNIEGEDVVCWILALFLTTDNSWKKGLLKMDI